MPLLLVSGAGVVIALLAWATRSWVVALAVYVATIAAVGLMLLRMAGGRPHERAGQTADRPQSALADSAAIASANTGLSLSETLARSESGLHRTRG